MFQKKISRCQKLILEKEKGKESSVTLIRLCPPPPLLYRKKMSLKAGHLYLKFNLYVLLLNEVLFPFAFIVRIFAG